MRTISSSLLRSSPVLGGHIDASVILAILCSRSSGSTKNISRASDGCAEAMPFCGKAAAKSGKKFPPSSAGRIILLETGNKVPADDGCGKRQPGAGRSGPTAIERLKEPGGL